MGKGERKGYRRKERRDRRHNLEKTEWRRKERK